MKQQYPVTAPVSSISDSIEASPESFESQMHHSTTPRQLSSAERTGIALFAAILVVLLITASVLKPNPAGLGTHRQLGLPGCTMVTLFGMRCPGCGMTTSWAHLLNGDLPSAIGANTGGTLLCLLSIACAPMLFWIAWRGHGTRGAWFSFSACIGLLVALTVATIEWLIRLVFG